MQTACRSTGSLAASGDAERSEAQTSRPLPDNGASSTGSYSWLEVRS
jgi:hypothetical protein